MDSLTPNGFPLTRPANLRKFSEVDHATVCPACLRALFVAVLGNVKPSLDSLSRNFTFDDLFMGLPGEAAQKYRLQTPLKFGSDVNVVGVMCYGNHCSVCRHSVRNHEQIFHVNCR